VNADVYHTRYSDIQEGQIIPGTASTVTSNIAAAGITGFEIEGNAAIGGWMQLTASVAYVDARYRDWFEYSTCAAQYWRPQCAGLAGATVVAIDHARGHIDIAGDSISFEPDRFLNTSRWQWSFQPELILTPWLARDVSLGATIYHRGPYVDAVATTNRSITAGVPMIRQDTVFGYSTANPFDARGYTLADIHVNWHNVAGTHFSLAAVVTNVANKVYRVSSSSPFLITGAAYSVVGEPRMGFAQATYRF
jgi:outer membrane receptor protein involved in Fe transport